MKIYCFYHSGDFDGKCSAAIIKLKYPDCILFGIDHGDEFPFNIIKQDDIVYMVDFSLPKDDMIKLNNMCDFIWIDHHISAINEKSLQNIVGFRLSDTAACNLTWKYFFQDKKIPIAVSLIGNYDIWNHKNPDVLPFQMGLKLYELNPEDSKWKKLFKTPLLYPFPYYKKFIKIGKYILKYQNNINKQMAKNAYKVEFEGYKCIALNSMYSNAFVFDSLFNVYDIKILYYNNGKHWTYSLYSESDINVGEIAKKYGGGGHFHAAGFQSNTLLF